MKRSDKKLLANLCGIDEAGRGPLAGPMVFAAVVLSASINELNDSKKLTEKKREHLFDLILQNQHHIVFITNQEIDNLGISACIKKALQEIMLNIKCDSFLFDGPHTYGVQNLQTMIKADSSVPEVMAASILAKVSRDRYMKSLEINGFDFAKHKGYGTKQHSEEIVKNGLTQLHRKSFCKKFLTKPC